MNPEQHNQQQQPTAPGVDQAPSQMSTPPSLQQFQPAVVAAESAPRRHKKLALTLLIAPTVLFILAIVCALIASSQGANPQDGDVFAAVSPLKQTMNILGFILGLVGFLTWLPGIIIGIILLTKKK